MRLALFEPDIPQNTGTILRLAACLGLGVDIIEPCGFAFSDRRLKRAGMDYIDRVSLIRHDSWADFEADKGDTRLILLTTKADLNYCEFDFTGTDTLLLGRESAGVPAQVHVVADARLTIP
ncbi:MAG: TrmH family RNA methyltransferase, partial [Rhodospirillales bacterium]|nr:TrmH family RNA methyltransferase [Rhodospirillales bacterium]